MNNKLVQRCRMDVSEFEKLGDCIQTKDGPVIHIDNGANVLAVAHLDYVLWANPKIKKDTIYCPQLDDRLGVWVILDVLKEVGINVDVLLTDSEECGRSTSQYFDSPKEYNWMFQFDRAGNDVVMYEYETDEHCEKLESVGWKVGNGSFSDICHLNHLACTGFNFGVGYWMQHTKKCYADLRDTRRNVAKFMAFYNKYADTPMPFDPDSVSWWYGGTKVIKYNQPSHSAYDDLSWVDYRYKSDLEDYLDDLACKFGYRDGQEFMDMEGFHSITEAIDYIEDVLRSINYVEGDELEVEFDEEIIDPKDLTS